MLVYKIETMNKIPDTCKDCKVQFCHLPLKGGKLDAELKKEYLIKRHKKCPLMEIEIEAL